MGHRRQHFAKVVHGPFTGWIILILAVHLTAAAWYVSRQAVQNAAEQRFDFRTEEIESAINDRMIAYEQVLWSGVGLFNASEAVSRDEWNNYVSTLDLNEHWPGIQGLGFAVPVTPDELDSHTEAVREEGFPAYAIKPRGERDEYTTIIYLEPFDWRNKRAFGFDMWSNATRREGMTRARDTGLAATSGVITLVQETDEDVQQGFLTYVPVYRDGAPRETVADRTDALEGWIYAAFRMGDLMYGILGPEADDVAYEVFDGSAIVEEALLFDSNGVFAGMDPTPDSEFRKTTSLEMQGRTWTIVYESSPDFISGSDAIQPTLIAAAGLIIDLLLFYVITSLGFLHKRAKLLAEDMTSELREAKDDLEERSQQLEAFTEQLQVSNAELEQFAHAASHDLQEPLRNIGSYSALLSKKYGGDLNDEGRRWLNYLTDGSQRMSDLLRELLRYASVDADPQAPTEVDLDEVVSIALVNLRDAIEESGARVDRAPLPRVLGDPVQLERVFQNLIGNAIKYRSARTRALVSITVSEDTREWRLMVRDNGIGIKPDYHERIFEIFRRVNSREDYPGTGIGLAVCQKVVKKHGGTIGVTSTPGRGSEFWFTLPKTPVASDQGGRSERLDHAEPPGPEPKPTGLRNIDSKI